jgi:GNAT superfamily N-acetyltransferase
VTAFTARLIRGCPWAALLDIDLPILTHRLAQLDDLPVLTALMTRSIETLQHGFLTPEQVRASHQVMGLDTQLVKDQTYFMIESEGQLVGCGGWSWRATLFGGDDSIVAREPLPLNPAIDAAKIRAMYVDPGHARRGIGTMIMALCEGAARGAGFAKVEMMATLAGVPLYRGCGYHDIEAVEAKTRDGVIVPLIRMGKAL